MRLGPIPRPAFGVRIPEILAPLLVGFARNLNMYITLMLSFNRETAPREYIESMDEKLFYFGHTGTSIEEFITKSRECSKGLNIVDVEADHVSIMGSIERALMRIAGVPLEYTPLSDSEIVESLRYVEKEFEEALKAGGVDSVTIDTSELIDFRIDKLGTKEIESIFESSFGEEYLKELKTRYLGKIFRFASKGLVIELKFSYIDLIKLALKYSKSIKYALKLGFRAMEIFGNDVSIEIALDETPNITSPKELFFYLNELRYGGLKPDFVAPNVGFAKREDYTGDLKELYDRISVLHTIASSMGTYISLHSGSGSNPYSDKGVGVWYVVRKATNGLVKYKMSGVLILLLLEVMSRFPPGSKVRKTYEEIYDSVLERLEEDLKSGRGLASEALRSMLERYREGERYDARADVFRNYFFVFQSIRDSKGFRYLRETIIELFNEDDKLRERYSNELYNLVLREANALNYVNSVIRYKIVRF